MPDGEADASRLLWRVSNYITLDGAGGLRASARWHTVGRRIVYLAESPAGAVFEAFVHLEVDPVAPPRHYRLLKVAVPPGVALAAWESAVPGVSLDDLDTTREAGDRWLTRGTTALLRVPSAILPETYNVLLNPAHPDARLIQVAAHERYPWHPRWGATPAPLARADDDRT